jgi:chromosome segregation ATPase
MNQSRVTVEDKIENLKQKMNATNIIKEDVFQQSAYSNKVYPIRQSYVPNGTSNFSFKESIRIDDSKNRLKEEVAQGVQLESEKKELELFVQDQIDTQNRLKLEYGRQIDAIKAHIDQLHTQMDDLEKVVEEKSDALLKRQDENNAVESEINELLEENRVIESELKRLGEKTTTKLRDMQAKMQSSLGDLENLKRKNQTEHDKIKQFSMEKIKRIEDDFRIKLDNHNGKLNELIVGKQNAELELLRLQDHKKRAEIDLENKIKAMKDQYYEEAFNQSKGILKVLNNRYKTAVDAREALLKKQEVLQHDLQMMDTRINEDEKLMAEENKQLVEAIGELREDVQIIQKDLDEIRTLGASVDAEQQRINAEIQKQKFNFKQISDTGKYKVREHLEKYKSAIDDSRTRLINQENRVKTLEEELAALKQRYNQTANQNAKLMESMKNQLNKQIYSTVAEYRDVSGAPKESYVNKSVYDYRY